MLLRLLVKLPPTQCSNPDFRFTVERMAAYLENTRIPKGFDVHTDALMKFWKVKGWKPFDLAAGPQRRTKALQRSSAASASAARKARNDRDPLPKPGFKGVSNTYSGQTNRLKTRAKDFVKSGKSVLTYQGSCIICEYNVRPHTHCLVHA
jgi:hypothetical protein